MTEVRRLLVIHTYKFGNFLYFFVVHKTRKILIIGLSLYEQAQTNNEYCYNYFVCIKTWCILCLCAIKLHYYPKYMSYMSYIVALGMKLLPVSWLTMVKFPTINITISNFNYH